MTRPSILVVEDEMITAMALRASLESMGYAVPATVATAEDAIERAKALKPDAVLMDIRLKGKIDGITAAETIRREVGSPVVYLTAYSDPETLRRARVTEPYGYIVKPYNENELRAVVEIAVHKGMMERARRAESEPASTNVFQAIIDVNPGAIYLKRADGRLLYVNRRFEELFGVPRGSAQGTVDGAILPQSLAQGDELAIRDRTVAQARETVRLPEGERTFLTIRMPLTRGDGSVYGLCTILTSVDQAAEAVSRLGTDITHTTGAPGPLVPLATSALVAHHDSLSAEARSFVSSVRKLISQLLTPGGASRSSAGEIELSSLAREITHRMSASAGEGPKVEFVIEPDLRARADQLLMRVVLESLFDNARKFTASRTLPRVEFGRADETEHDQVFFVRDNGIGFDPASATRLFQPFVRLHREPTYSGIGLGLSAVRSYIEAHGGRVWAEGKPDHGATFFFSLPRP